MEGGPYADVAFDPVNASSSAFELLDVFDYSTGCAALILPLHAQMLS